MHAKRANHICLVETWIKPDQGSTIDFQMNDRSFEHASIGKGKGCAIYSSISQKTTYVGKIAKENFMEDLSWNAEILIEDMMGYYRL